MQSHERSENTGSDAEGNIGESQQSAKGKKAKLMANDNPGITMEQVFELISKMNEQNQQNMLTAIAEMKKPSAREQAEIDAKEKRVAEQQKARIQLAQSEERRKELNRLGCPHSTFHPGTGVRKHSWRAQVHTPAGEKPYFKPTCTQCWTQGPKILATPDMLTNGVNLDQYADIDLARLEAWAKQVNTAA